MEYDYSNEDDVKIVVQKFINLTNTSDFALLMLFTILLDTKVIKPKPFLQKLVLKYIKWKYKTTFPAVISTYKVRGTEPFKLGIEQFVVTMMTNKCPNDPKAASMMSKQMFNGFCALIDTAQQDIYNGSTEKKFGYLLNN